MNINTIISHNILSLMKEKGRKKEDMAAAMQVTKSEVIWMLNQYFSRASPRQATVLSGG